MVGAGGVVGLGLYKTSEVHPDVRKSMSNTVAGWGRSFDGRAGDSAPCLWRAGDSTASEQPIPASELWVLWLRWRGGRGFRGRPCHGEPRRVRGRPCHGEEGAVGSG